MIKNTNIPEIKNKKGIIASYKLINNKFIIKCFFEEIGLVSDIFPCHLYNIKEFNFQAPLLSDVTLIENTYHFNSPYYILEHSIVNPFGALFIQSALSLIDCCFLNNKKYNKKIWKILNYIIDNYQNYNFNSNIIEMYLIFEIILLESRGIIYNSETNQKITINNTSIEEKYDINFKSLFFETEKLIRNICTEIPFYRLLIYKIIQNYRN
ncbi:hypothetical protein [Lyticum sinuosum]|uniref:Uncharacterized protein n=1 Tax=Lyticum sinuosum TaxID=1332059 RepID=A0AAE5AHG5_9RICK|nr:hypothetical protein [Lyticum sinuosum]MDZ5760996.1 hypothetical protein [Lyticum sinuosum]